MVGINPWFKDWARIQCSASVLISVADFSRESIKGPILTRIVPDFLIKKPRGQNRPALCAMGRTGYPVAEARAAPLLE